MPLSQKSTQAQPKANVKAKRTYYKQGSIGAINAIVKKRIPKTNLWRTLYHRITKLGKQTGFFLPKAAFMRLVREIAANVRGVTGEEN